MRLIYFSALVASVGVLSPGYAAMAQAAAATSSADRARIAMLVYQSQSARQADLRRGDAATRALRISVEAADAKSRVLKAQLAALRTEGDRNRARAGELGKRLEEQEVALAEAAERYAEELAGRDRDYARERSILISTGQRLLATPEGRRVLDLYNAGGQANWNEARRVLDEARRVRRALDNRDAAKLYMEAYKRGLEKNAAVTALYEEVVRDDPKNSGDWMTLATLYNDVGRSDLVKRASEQMAKLAANVPEQFMALLTKARAHPDAGTPEAQGDFEAAIRFALDNFERSPSRGSNFMAGLALWAGSYPFMAREEWESARERLQKSIVHLRAAQTPGKLSTGDNYLSSALLDLGNTLYNSDQFSAAQSNFEAALALARQLFAEHSSRESAETLYFALEAAAAGRLQAGHLSEAHALLSEALPFLEKQIAADPSVERPREWLIDIVSHFGKLELKRKRYADSIRHYNRSLQLIADNFPSSSHWSVKELQIRLELGKSYVAAGLMPQANSEYQRVIRKGRAALKESPDSEILLSGLSEALLAAGGVAIGTKGEKEAQTSLNEAQQLLRHGLKLHPNSKNLLELENRANALEDRLAKLSAQP